MSRRQLPSASSAISGRDSVATSAAIRPYASVQPTRASPAAVTTHPRRVPRHRRSQAERISDRLNQLPRHLRRFR